jgi:hypothetical protein
MDGKKIDKDLHQAIDLINRALSEAAEIIDIRDDSKPRRVRANNARATSQAVKLYKRGMSVTDVAAEIGVSYPTARKMIKSSGVDIRDLEQRVASRKPRKRAA